MQEVILDLQTITPLFMAGGEYSFIDIPEGRRVPPQRRQQGKQGTSLFAKHGWKLQAEIRPPSFRGLMRYWLRAALGGLFNASSIGMEDMVQFEQSVFGATDQGSAINLRVTDILGEPREFKKDEESISQATVTGKDYLLWSMAESGYGKNYKPERLYYPEGTQFKIILSEYRVDSATPSMLPYAVASLWLLTHLGGIGSRSHRCAGSLQVQRVAGESGNLLFTEATSKEELQTNLQQEILKIQTLNTAYLQGIKKHGAGQPISSAPFDSLRLLHKGDSPSSPHSCRIWVLLQNNGSSWQTLKDALNTIGTRLKTYRSTLTPQERATFGLPLNIRLPPYDKELENALQDNRRASPLLLRITKLRTGGYVGIAVLFKTAASSIRDPTGKHVLIPAPDYGLIEDWVATKFPQALEVRL